MPFNEFRSDKFSSGCRYRAAGAGTSGMKYWYCSWLGVHGCTSSHMYTPHFMGHCSKCSATFRVIVFAHYATFWGNSNAIASIHELFMALKSQIILCCSTTMYEKIILKKPPEISLFIPTKIMRTKLLPH
eukprot:SAG31_NODE_1465_length_8232_cov_31.250830_4_plen_130_part_00